ncbi:MAG: Fe-S-containing protein [Clostridiaceae bacterium]|jgi:uncharacterized membrane protein|nr:Fe-S-containing protein [Clostridiaceae bacterium]
MLKYLIDVINNSLVTGIVIALLTASVAITDKRMPKRWLILSIAAGVIAAFVLAVLKENTKLVNRNQINAVILIAAIVAVAAFLFFSWKYRGNASEKAWFATARYAVSCFLTALLLFYCLPTIFLYPFGFVAVDQSIFSTDFLFKLIGWLLGLFVVIVSALMLFKIAVKMPYGITRLFTTAVFIFNLVKQFATLFQSFFLRGILVSTKAKGLSKFVLEVVNHADVFIYVLITLTLALAVFLWIKGASAERNLPVPAERRKSRAEVRRQRRIIVTLAVGYVFSIVAMTALFAYDNRPVQLSIAERPAVVGDEILISLDSVADGHLYRYVFTASNGKDVRFIIVRKSETTYGVGLDACDICGETGYYERGNEVVCKLCDVVMNKSTIGFKGGCNPVPLSYLVRGGNIVIKTADLEAEKNRFK